MAALAAVATAGASGFLLKNADPDQLVEVEAVAAPAAVATAAPH